MSNVEKYKDMMEEERAKKSEIRHKYIKETIRGNKLPQDFPREALDSNSYSGKDGVVGNRDLAMFYTNYGHPRNWVPVLRYFPKLRLCLAGTGMCQYMFAKKVNNGAIPGKEWFDYIRKLTRYENVYVDISGLNIEDDKVREALPKMLDMIQRGYNEFKHLKYKLMFGSGWYLAHLMDVNNNIDYNGYCGRFKRIFNAVDKSGVLWERVSLINPWRFYGFGDKIKNIQQELDSYNGENVDTNMLKTMKDIFGDSNKRDSLVGYISCCYSNDRKEIANIKEPDEKDPVLKTHGNNCFCGKKHIDLRNGKNGLEWISQLNKIFGDRNAQKKACFKACKLLLEKTGVTTSHNDVYQVAKEKINVAQTDKKQQIKYLSINTEDAKAGLAYIDQQLAESYPVIVGVDHTYGQTYNERTTDHFVLIVGRGCDNKKTYYLFYEVGTEHPHNGKSDNNKLYVGNEFSLSGNTAYKPERNYFVTLVYKNVLKTESQRK